MTAIQPNSSVRQSNRRMAKTSDISTDLKTLSSCHFITIV